MVPLPSFLVLLTADSFAGSGEMAPVHPALEGFDPQFRELVALPMIMIRLNKATCSPKLFRSSPTRNILIPGSTPLTFHPHGGVSSHSHHAPTMSYPRPITTMAQELLDDPEDNPSLHEIRFYMLWNAILHHHFPLHLNYGLIHQTLIAGGGTEPEFLVIRIGLESEHIVVGAVLKKSADGIPGAKDKVVKELVDYIEERLTKTKYPAIYGIAGIGLWWTALKMGGAGSRRLTTLVPWNDNVASNESFLSLKTVVDEIHAMSVALPRRRLGPR